MASPLYVSTADNLLIPSGVLVVRVEEVSLSPCIKSDEIGNRNTLAGCPLTSLALIFTPVMSGGGLGKVVIILGTQAQKVRGTEVLRQLVTEQSKFRS